MTRERIRVRDIEGALDEVQKKLSSRLAQKGDGAYAGPHETYGILAEEFHELMLAMHANGKVNFWGELLDIAVAAILGMASSLPADTSQAGT